MTDLRSAARPERRELREQPAPGWAAKTVGRKPVRSSCRPWRLGGAFVFRDGGDFNPRRTSLRMGRRACPASPACSQADRPVAEAPIRGGELRRGTRPARTARRATRLGRPEAVHAAKESDGQMPMYSRRRSGSRPARPFARRCGSRVAPAGRLPRGSTARRRAGWLIGWQPLTDTPLVHTAAPTRTSRLGLRKMPLQTPRRLCEVRRLARSYLRRHSPRRPAKNPAARQKNFQ